MRILVEVDQDNGGYTWATYDPDTDKLFDTGRADKWGTALALGMHRGVRECIIEFGPELDAMIDHLQSSGMEVIHEETSDQRRERHTHEREAEDRRLSHGDGEDGGSSAPGHS